MEVELQGAGIRRGYVRGGSRAAGGVSEGKIRLRQPLTGQGARARDAGLQGLSCPCRLSGFSSPDEEGAGRSVTKNPRMRC